MDKAERVKNLPTIRPLPESLSNFIGNPMANMNPMAELLQVADEFNLILAEQPTVEEGCVTLRMSQEAFDELIKNGVVKQETDEGEEYTQTVEPEPDDYQQDYDEEKDDEREVIEKGV